MRIIKIFEEFESNLLDIKSIKNDVNDILLDIRDLGFRSDFKLEKIDTFKSSHGKNIISYRLEFRLECVDLSISNIDDVSPYTIDFESDLIKEDVSRVVDYLKSLSKPTETFTDRMISIYNQPYNLFTMPTRWSSLNDFLNGEESKEIYVFRMDGWIYLES